MSISLYLLSLPTAQLPTSIIASTFAYDDNPNDYFYEPEDKRDYFIIINYEELFKSKTGNIAKSNE